MSEQTLTTRDKAMAVNMDSRDYGTFAEIGAGQEVARWFFQVGGAAGTIAKSISAYDMQVSDAIYGKCKRYVCRERLEQMLDYEQDLNVERLQDSRGRTTRFFTFADTVAARNYKGTNNCHGWLGIKFQSRPMDEVNQIILHVRMLDPSNQQQQEALGIVGVNLVYGALNLYHDPDKLLMSLLDGLNNKRIEIDMIEFSGIEFRHIDNRLMSLKLVQNGFSNAAMFSPEGKVLQPSEMLYKKNLIVERGSFRPVTHVNLDMLRCAEEVFNEDHSIEEDKILTVSEITMKNLLADGEICYKDFLARVDALSACGQTVLISNYAEYYRLVAFLRRYTDFKISIVMGTANLIELLDEKYYTNLEGGILESLGRLFKNETSLYIYPTLNRETDKLITAENLSVAPEITKLYGYLLDKGSIQQLKNFNPDVLNVYSREVLAKIKAGDPSWEEGVPEVVAKIIKERKLFSD